MDSLKVGDFRANFCNKLQALETVVDLRDAHQDDTASCNLDVSIPFLILQQRAYPITGVLITKDSPITGV